MKVRVKGEGSVEGIESKEDVCKGLRSGWREGEGEGRHLFVETPGDLN